MTIKLGDFVHDRVTHFTGFVTGRAEYLTGCVQMLVVPRCGADGAYREGQWFDEQRLVLNRNSLAIVLDNSAAKGFDKAAPKR